MVFLKTVCIAVLVGGLSGLAHSVISNKKSLDKPKMYKSKLYLGFLGDIFLGAIAAVFAVTYLVPDPDTVREVVGISILAGIGSESVLLNRRLDNEQAKVQYLEKIDDRLVRVVDKKSNDNNK